MLALWMYVAGMGFIEQLFVCYGLLGVFFGSIGYTWTVEFGYFGFLGLFGLSLDFVVRFGILGTRVGRVVEGRSG